MIKKPNNLEDNNNKYEEYNQLEYEICMKARENGMDKIYNLNPNFNLKEEELIFNEWYSGFDEIEGYIAFKDVDCQDNELKLTPLMLSIIGSEDTPSLFDLQDIYKFKPNLNLQNIYGDTFIHMLAVYNFGMTISDMLEYGYLDKFDINIQNNNGNTLLHLICNEKIFEPRIYLSEYFQSYDLDYLIKLILEKNPDLTIKNNKGETPMLENPVEFYLNNEYEEYYY